VSGERAAPGQRDSTVYTTNMATPAANIATVVIATTTHPKRELGWPCISFLSEATDQDRDEIRVYGRCSVPHNFDHGT
jgi:hypothetical protein